ncbi:MAG: helix-turn-helix domain-containing protein [Gudongella sp.]|jgi:hypothetical protein|nr:helix-turn-helix domain-containing protein [Gudongella sp.]
MNIIDIVNTGSNISVSVPIEDLLKFANVLIENTKRELEEAITKEKDEAQLSPREVSDILGVDLSTLWRWQKRGYLVPVEIGGKRRYKMSEVKDLLNGGRRG